MKTYQTPVACAVCRAALTVEVYRGGKLTPAGVATLKAAGWRFVATVGLWCPACQRRERELEDRALRPSSALPGPNPARRDKEQP